MLAELRAKGGEVRYVQADIASRDDRERLVAAVRAAFGRLNLLVNNAGVAPAVRADLLESGEESFDRLLGINLKGPYFLTQAVARWMTEQKQQAGYQGAIVFVTSMSAEAASPEPGRVLREQGRARHDGAALRRASRRRRGFPCTRSAPASSTPT